MSRLQSFGRTLRAAYLGEPVYRRDLLASSAIGLGVAAIMKLPGCSLLYQHQDSNPTQTKTSQAKEVERILLAAGANVHGNTNLSDSVVVYYGDIHDPTYFTPALIEVIRSHNSLVGFGVLGLEGFNGELSSEDVDGIRDWRDAWSKMDDSKKKADPYNFDDSMVFALGPEDRAFIQIMHLPCAYYQKPGVPYAVAFESQIPLLGVDPKHTEATDWFNMMMYVRMRKYFESFLGTDLEFEGCNAEFAEKQIAEIDQVLAKYFKIYGEREFSEDELKSGARSQRFSEFGMKQRSLDATRILSSFMKTKCLRRGALIFGVGHEEQIVEEFENLGQSYLVVE